MQSPSYTLAALPTQQNTDFGHHKIIFGTFQRGILSITLLLSDAHIIFHCIPWLVRGCEEGLSLSLSPRILYSDIVDSQVSNQHSPTSDSFSLHDSLTHSPTHTQCLYQNVFVFPLPMPFYLQFKSSPLPQMSSKIIAKKQKKNRVRKKV
jgi:hypothetical protein